MSSNKCKSFVIPKIIKNFVGGKFMNSTSDKTFETLNPATGTAICKVQSSSKEDLDFAIKTTIDTGKCITESLSVDIESAASAFEYYGSLAADALTGKSIPLPGAPANFAYTRREPLGVVAAIGAWNYPLQIAAWKTAPALACGNAVVFKPSELSPITASFLGEILNRAELDPGAFNVVNGGGEVGHALAAHPDVSKVSFTGSTATGTKILKTAADTFKSVTLETGGKSPFIVFPDADLDQAVSAALLANFYTNGEICSNGTRILVHKDIEKDFLEEFVRRTKLLKIGRPLESSSQIGPLISSSHFKRVERFVSSAKASGAKLLFGGEKVEVKGSEGGNYLSPAIFANCSNEMEFVREEIFGPVAAVLSFEGEAEAVGVANDSRYGLAGGVFTRDIQRAHRVAGALECGTVWINNYNVNELNVPFGGYKMSGIGRECGEEVLKELSQVKSVYVEMGKVDCPYE